MNRSAICNSRHNKLLHVIIRVAGVRLSRRPSRGVTGGSIAGGLGSAVAETNLFSHRRAPRRMARRGYRVIHRQSPAGGNRSRRDSKPCGREQLAAKTPSNMLVIRRRASSMFRSRLRDADAPCASITPPTQLRTPARKPGVLYEGVEFPRKGGHHELRTAAASARAAGKQCIKHCFSRSYVEQKLGGISSRFMVSRAGALAQVRSRGAPDSYRGRGD
jgi:hypothetical protein